MVFYSLKSFILHKPYQKYGKISFDILKNQRIDLVFFYGIDTSPEINLNDQVLGNTSNMFIWYRCDVYYKKQIFIKGPTRLHLPLLPKWWRKITSRSCWRQLKKMPTWMGSGSGVMESTNSQNAKKYLFIFIFIYFRKRIFLKWLKFQDCGRAWNIDLARYDVCLLLFVPGDGGFSGWRYRGNSTASEASQPASIRSHLSGK